MKNTALLFGFIVLACITTVIFLEKSSAERASQPAQTPPQQSSAPAEKGPMKTLQDFTPITAKAATIKTSKGDIVVELYPDKAPLTVTNFLTLAKDGYYDGIKFHRVIPGFVAQGGDPYTKDAAKADLVGSGGPGYSIADEFDPSLRHNVEGILSMANSGPNTGGSQFFITYAATPHLDDKHAVFGKVTSGMDVAKSLQVSDTIISITY
jgi:cyclophilin family peptidyl-prolyl cis-trans isomerase